MPDALATYKLPGPDPPGRPTRLTGYTSGRIEARPRTPKWSPWTVQLGSACYAAFDENTDLLIHQRRLEDRDESGVELDLSGVRVVDRLAAQGETSALHAQHFSVGAACAPVKVSDFGPQDVAVRVQSDDRGR